MGHFYFKFMHKYLYWIQTSNLRSLVYPLYLFKAFCTSRYLADPILKEFYISEGKLPICQVMGKSMIKSNKKARKKKDNHYRSLAEDSGHNSDYNTHETEPSQDIKVVSNVQSGFVLCLCENILGHVYIRMFMYIIVTIALSTLSSSLTNNDLQNLRQVVYTAQPKNVLNEFFVKLAFGWTLGLVLPPAILASFTLHSWSGILWSLVRALVSTVVWFGFTNLFDVFRKSVAAGFDTSGHCFLLIWCIYYIIEESQVWKHWNRSMYPILRLPLNIFYILQAVIVVLWDVMLISTIIFYHTLLEKLVGVILALGVWLFLYKGMYVWLHPWFQLPRKGLLS